MSPEERERRGRNRDAAGRPRRGVGRPDLRQPVRRGSGGRSSILGYVGRFVAGWVAVLLLVTLVPGIERVAIAATVGSVMGVLRVVSFQAFVTGASILVGRHPIEITPDCTPLMPTGVLWVAIAVFPATLSWRLAGALVGALALWLYNLCRILVMIAVLNTHPSWFEFVHIYMWQTLTLVVVIGLFLIWLRFEPRMRGAG